MKHWEEIKDIILTNREQIAKALSNSPWKLSKKGKLNIGWRVRRCLKHKS